MSFNDAAPPDNDLIDKNSHHSNTYNQENVSWLSNVGLAGDEKTGGLGVLKGTIAGDTWEIYGNLRNENFTEAAFGVAGVSASVYEAAVDPFGFVGTQIAKWMLEHIEPLRQPYEELCGNPTIVEAYSKSWQAISQELSKTRDTWSSTIEKDISSWSGTAGDAYRNHAKEVLTTIDTAAATAASLAKQMEIASKGVAIARDLMRDVIASLLGAAIGYTAELAVTVGAAAGHVVSAFLAKFAKSCLDVSAYLAKLQGIFFDLATYREPLAKALAALAPTLKSVAEYQLNQGKEWLSEAL